VLGSRVPFDLALDRIKPRLARPEVARDLAELDRIDTEAYCQLTPVDRSRFDDALPVVTDDRPHLEFYLWRYWHAGLPKAHRRFWHQK